MSDESASMPCEDCQTTVGCQHTVCPYAYEIHGDTDLHWLCDACAHERAMDV